MFDLLIIGGGPAGMTAAVYAARKLLNTLMLTEDIGGQVLWTRDIQNYMGYQMVTGQELTAKFEEQVKLFPITIESDKVVKLEQIANGFAAYTESGQCYQAKAVILASGKRPRRLNIPGETELTGMGVSYCATCDGPLFSGLPVAVIGGGNSAVQAALELAKLADKVYLISRGAYVADPIVIKMLGDYNNIEELKEYDSEKIIGQYAVEKLVVQPRARSEAKRELDVRGIFVEIGLIPNSEYVRELVTCNQAGEIIVDCRTRTNIPGLFGAGDITNGPDKQIIIAAGDGAKAALVAFEYLLHLP